MTDLDPSPGCMLFENEGNSDKQSCTIEVVVKDVSSELARNYYVRRNVTFSNLGIKEVNSENVTEQSGASLDFFVELRGNWDPRKDIDVGPDHIGAFVRVEEVEQSLEIKATCTLSMLNINGIEMARGVADKVYWPDAYGWMWVYSYELLLKNPLLIDDFVRFRAEIEFTIVTEPEVPVLCAPSDLSARSCSAIFNSPRFSDFQLQSSDGKVLHVHKFILGLRSEVFSTMFQHKLKESLTGKCVIDDVDGETLEAMIKFLYGRNEWKPHLAEKLIVAADKYKILDLVDGCTRELINQFTARNVSRLLKLGDQINAHKLKDAALIFIAGNLDGFLQAGGFIDLVEDVGLLQELQESSTQLRKNKKQKTTA